MVIVVVVLCVLLFCLCVDVARVVVIVCCVCLSLLPLVLCLCLFIVLVKRCCSLSYVCCGALLFLVVPRRLSPWFVLVVGDRCWCWLLCVIVGCRWCVLLCVVLVLIGHCCCVSLWSFIVVDCFFGVVDVVEYCFCLTHVWVPKHVSLSKHPCATTT